MKQRDLTRKLELIGFEFARHGSNHDIYKRGNDEEKIPSIIQFNNCMFHAG